MLIILDYQKFGIPGIEGATIMVRPLEVLDYQRLVRFTSKAIKAETTANPQLIDDLQEIVSYMPDGPARKELNDLITEVKKSVSDADNLERMADEDISFLSKEIIPKYCKDLTGIEFQIDGARKNATVEDLILYGSFIIPCYTILTHLLTLSSMTPAEESDLKKTPPVATQEEESTPPLELLPASPLATG